MRTGDEGAATVYCDANCSRPYIVTSSNTTVTTSNDQIVISETAPITGLRTCLVITVPY
jgi:hypothetical protein